MPDLVADFVSRRRWAVVGVSDDHHKFGRRIFEDMRDAGYDVVPVHPAIDVLDDGTKVYPRISAIPEPVEVVDMVIPAKAAPAVLRDMAQAGVTRVWFQPGAADQAAVDLAKELGLEVIAGGPCCMIEKKRW
jgi:predicted CoA-binding protein